MQGYVYAEAEPRLQDKKPLAQTIRLVTNICAKPGAVAKSPYSAPYWPLHHANPKWRLSQSPNHRSAVTLSGDEPPELGYQTDVHFRPVQVQHSELLVEKHVF